MGISNDPRQSVRNRRALNQLQLLLSGQPSQLQGTVDPSALVPSDTIGDILRTVANDVVLTVTVQGDGTFSVPAGITSLLVECWAGGGGGDSNQGGGGGGGAYSASTLTVTPSTDYPYHVGAGGIVATDGENTTFNTTDVIAAAGKGASGATHGAGGTVAGCTGTTKYAGGAGADGTTFGGGGGSSAFSTGVGIDAIVTSGGGSGGTSTEGGIGGDGGNAVGSNGVQPGGGGGGGGLTSLGGNGANGQIRITYAASSVPIAAWDAETTEVNTGNINELAWYAATGKVVSGLTPTAANSVLITTAGGVPILAVDLPAGITIGSIAFILANGANAFTADQSMGSHKLTNVTNPTSAQDAATKNYVDVAVAAIAEHQECLASSTIAITEVSYTNNGGVGDILTLLVGVLLLDGQSLSVGGRYLIKNQANAAHNGIWVCTNAGSGITSPVFVRATDFDQEADGIAGGIVFVQNGTLNEDTRWVCSASGVITWGTTNLNWSQFLGGVYTGDETTVHLSGTTFSVKSDFFSALSESDLAVDDEVPYYDLSATTDKKITTSKFLGFASSSLCEGRLTLTSGTAVTTTDVTAVTNVYFTPFIGDRITIYDGTRLRLYQFSEVTYALGTTVTFQAYDLFIYDNAGTLTLESAEWSNATITSTSATPAVITWTAHALATGNACIFTNSGGALPAGISANTIYYITKVDANTFKLSTSLINVGTATFVNTTTTGTGTHTGHSPTNRATALVAQNGAWYKTGALTRRYVGSFMATSTTGTEDSVARRFLFNAHNRRPADLRVFDTTASWTYNSATLRQARASTANEVQIFVGLNEEIVDLVLIVTATSGTSSDAQVSIGEDTTTTQHATAGTSITATNTKTCLTSILRAFPNGVGYHVYVWIEWQQTITNAATFTSGSASGSPKSGIVGRWVH